jgi:hypothetical protein
MLREYLGFLVDPENGKFQFVKFILNSAKHSFIGPLTQTVR